MCLYVHCVSFQSIQNIVTQPSQIESDVLIESNNIIMEQINQVLQHEHLDVGPIIHNQFDCGPSFDHISVGSFFNRYFIFHTLTLSNNWNILQNYWGS